MHPPPSPPLPPLPFADTSILTMGNFSRWACKYTRDLIALENASQVLPRVPYHCSLSSPLPPDRWDSALATIPDRPFVHFLMRGIKLGFRIGVTADAQYKPSARNLKSGYERPDIISAYLQCEVELGRLHALPSLPHLSPPLLQISPFDAIPKKLKPDKWKLIVDLSSPKGRSVNDAISSKLCSVSYTSLDQAVEFVRNLGEGCLLAKLDLKEAYRAVPVHPSDQRLLAVSWQGTTYIDRALPFGLRSAPKIFSALTDAMMWMLRARESRIRMALHYLDDFLILGPPGSPLCGQALANTLALCEELGFPVTPEKTEGLATTLTFLGIEVDSVLDQVHLPQEKLDHLLTAINRWMEQADAPTPLGAGKKRELLSLIGLLTHAATVPVQPHRYCCHCPGSGPQGSPETNSSSGHCMVAHLPQDVEWHKRYTPSKRAIPDFLRCIRGMGLRCEVCQPMVSTRMAGQLVHSLNRPQTVGAHCRCSDPLGLLLGREMGSLSLQQYSCCGSGEQGRS